MCHGQLQASCGALTCLCDCNYYIGTGGVTEVAHCRLSSYHNLQSVLAQQARRRLALRRLQRVWHAQRSGRTRRRAQSRRRRWGSVRGQTGQCRQGWLLSRIVIKWNKGRERQSVSLLLIRVLHNHLACWHARLHSGWRFGIDATKVRGNWVVRVLQKARELLLVPDHVLGDDHAAMATLCRQVPEFPTLEVVWDAQEHAGLCVRLQAPLLLAMNVRPCVAAKDAQCRVGLVLVRHLVWRCVGQDCR
jgi:hypothetical protein